MITPEPSFEHIVRLTDQHGTFEHADHTTPRSEHGYCTDDMARLLVVTSREPEGDIAVEGLHAAALRFVIDAQGPQGSCRNRMSSDGIWHGPWVAEDCWGRSLWGLGTAAARANNPETREVALAAFERGTGVRSRWPRAMAYAALGAAEVLSASSGHEQARSLMVDAAGALGRRGSNPRWPWPEPRLTYANALLPEAMIAAGGALDREPLLQDGLELLGWLLDRETRGDHLSVTPVGGAGPNDCSPAFDQQPIEVATLADACARAARIDDSTQWAEGLRRAVDWFLGHNDAQTPMWNPGSGGGYDGLHHDGPNLNQGAESTLAAISTLQHARDLTARPAYSVAP